MLVDDTLADLGARRRESREPMPALTLWPEWLPCFTHLDKRIENRTWPPPPWLLGKRVALHAGRSIGGGSTRKGLQWVTETAKAAGWDLSPGTDARGRLAPSLVLNRNGRITEIPIPMGVVAATARLARPTKAPSRWAMEGQYHWVFEDLHVLETPVPAVGRQGIWWWSPPEGFVDG